MEAIGITRECGRPLQMHRGQHPAPETGGAAALLGRRRLIRQLACKPGSVWRRCRRVTTIHLGRPLPDASRYLPGRLAGKQTWAKALRRPYSVLLPVGFTVPDPLPGPRWALTPPFHPYLAGRNRHGGLLSVALSLGSPPPDVIRHRVSVEPGLSSPAAFRHLPVRPSSRLTHWRWQ
jgi:hypothetical protein